MIALIIFSLICFVIMWFVIFKVILIYQKKSLFKNIPDKLEKQDKKFFNDGKEVNIKELLGKEEIKKEVVEEVSEEGEETIEDVHPQPEPEQIVTVKEQVEKVYERAEKINPGIVEKVEKKQLELLKPITKLPTFNDEFKLPGKEE